MPLPPTYLNIEYEAGGGRIKKKLYLRSDGEDELDYIYATARKSDTRDGPLMLVRLPKEIIR